MVLRRGNRPFSYELVVSVIDASNFENESPVFPVKASLSFTRCRRSAKGETLFYWNDVEKDADTVWEFVVSDATATSSTTIEMFQMTMAQCIFEFETGRSQANATDSDLKQFLLNDLDEPVLAPETAAEDKANAAADDPDMVVFESEPAGFYVFDSNTGLFVSQAADEVKARLVRDAKRPWEFRFKLVGGKVVVHEQEVDSDATQHLDRQSCSFIWCHFAKDAGHLIYTYSLKFSSLPATLSFAHHYNQCVYETLNQERWSKVDASDARYLLNPMLDVEMSHAEAFNDADTSTDSSDSDEVSEVDIEEESRISMKPGGKGGLRNQMLAVGFKSDRSFVARGSSIGVFKHSEDDRLSFVTETALRLKGHDQPISPSKMMLHQEDRSLLLMSEDTPHSVFRMDLERGEVVDEWRIHDDARISSMLPDSKYAQLTGQETFIGMNANSIFRVDPRLPGCKRVDSEMKSYVVKNNFSCGATTGHGELAVASSKGEIRLFNQLDKRAKTLLPMFGDAILGIDVTESGRYILATCKTYLLLICTELPGGDTTGFTRSMPAAEKPIPKRLQLKPEHIAYMGQAPSFTPARFSTGQSEERSIITSSGPYVITWNLRRVKQGHLHDYQIKRYEDTVVADNFRYGQDRSIIVTLPEQVTLISKKSMAVASPRSLRQGSRLEHAP